MRVDLAKEIERWRFEASALASRIEQLVHVMLTKKYTVLLAEYLTITADPFHRTRDASNVNEVSLICEVLHWEVALESLNTAYSPPVNCVAR